VASNDTPLTVTVTKRDDVARLQAIIDAADVETPTPQAIKDMQAAFDEFPGLYRHVGDLARVALTKLGYGTSGGKALGAAALERYAGELRRELGCAHANPLERLLIEDVVLCWLEMNAIRGVYIQVTTYGTSHRMDVGAYDDRRLSAAHKRYSRAVETLARVRRFGITLPSAPAADDSSSVSAAERLRAVG
jgi:hypothetical protein